MVKDILVTALIEILKKKIFPTLTAIMQPQAITDWVNFLLFSRHLTSYLSCDFLQMWGLLSPNEIQNLDSSLKLTCFHWSRNIFWSKIFRIAVVTFWTTLSCYLRGRQIESISPLTRFDFCQLPKTHKRYISDIFLTFCHLLHWSTIFIPVLWHG